MNNMLITLKKPMAVHALVLILVSIYWALRMSAFSGLSGDEAEQVLFAQSFRWGYDVANPPLYTWILIALFSVFGKSAGLVVAFKLCILAGIYLALHHAARLSLGNERRLDWALVALSPLLIFFMSWHAIFSYSHSLLNALFIVLTFSALHMVIKDGRLRWYVVLGSLIGLGIMTKYAYVMFLLALISAGMSLTMVRSRLLNRSALVTVIIASAIIAPHVAWLWASADMLKDAISYKLETGQDISTIKAIGKGLWSLLRSTFAFLSPLWLIVLLVFPAIFKKTRQADLLPIAAPLLSRTFLAIIILMLSMVVLGGVTQFRPNYLFILILFPLWVFARLPAEPVPGKRRRVYAGLVMTACALSVGGLAAKAVLDPLRCKKCQFLIPYEKIAKELQRQGFNAGSVFATWYPNPLPGNLALYLPDSRIVSHKFIDIIPPARQHAKNQTGQCMAVWVPRERGGKTAEAAAGSTNAIFGTKLPPNQPSQRIELPLYRAPDKTVLIDYFIINPGQADCR
ncbi:MAG: glycosyltransferase family 39 protein [Magnetovibrio sp.]|nr:glycosyltransferase family 39 protein [Magnetovibrio sp.]